MFVDPKDKDYAADDIDCVMDPSSDQKGYDNQRQHHVYSWYSLEFHIVGLYNRDNHNSGMSTIIEISGDAIGDWEGREIRCIRNIAFWIWYFLNILNVYIELLNK